MSPRALHLADVLCGQLAELDGVCSLSVSELASWHRVHIGAASNANLFRLADDLGLDPGRTGSRVWWPQIAFKPGGRSSCPPRAPREGTVRAPQA